MGNGVKTNGKGHLACAERYCEFGITSAGYSPDRVSVCAGINAAGERYMNEGFMILVFHFQLLRLMRSTDSKKVTKRINSYRSHRTVHHLMYNFYFESKANF